jgi:hypothetical protein
MQQQHLQQQHEQLQQQQQDGTIDYYPPSSFSSAISSTCHDRFCRLGRQTTISRLLFIVLLSLWNIGSAPQKISRYSPSSSASSSLLISLSQHEAAKEVGVAFLPNQEELGKGYNYPLQEREQKQKQGPKVLVPPDAATTALGSNKTNNNNNDITSFHPATEYTPHNDNPPKRSNHYHPDSSSSTTFMSACLLWMDDNHYLVEWLAYHYTVLPLRRLIMCVDPKSQTSPLSLLERYSSRGLLNITVWYDDDFFPRVARDRPAYVNNPTRTFLARQSWCYLQCMRTIKKDYTIPPSPPTPTSTTPSTTTPPSNTTASTTMTTTRNYDPLDIDAQNQQQQQARDQQQQPPIWVTMFDLDEFIVLNHLRPNPSLGLNEIKPTILEVLSSPKNSIAPPRHHRHNHTNNPCVPLSRLALSTVESDGGPSEVQQWIPPTMQSYSTWSGMNFKTLRYHYLIPSMLNGKALVDVRYADPQRDLKSIQQVNAHRPLMHHCTQNNVAISTAQAALGVYHYPGTLEQYTFRSRDARNWTRLPKKYAALNRKRSHVMDTPNARVWLQAFVDQVGPDVAVALLQGAGEINPQ